MANVKEKEEYDSGPWLVIHKIEDEKNHTFIFDLQHEKEKGKELKQCLVLRKLSPGSHKLCFLGYHFYTYDTHQRMFFLDSDNSRKHDIQRVWFNRIGDTTSTLHGKSGLGYFSRFHTLHADSLSFRVHHTPASISSSSSSSSAVTAARSFIVDQSRVDQLSISAKFEGTRSSSSSTPASAIYTDASAMPLENELISSSNTTKQLKTREWILSLKKQTPLGVCPFFYHLGNCKKKLNCKDKHEYQFQRQNDSSFNYKSKKK